MIYRNQWIIEISFHARKKAKYKGITFDMVHATVKTGRIERFGKNGIKFICSYKRGDVVCVGEQKSGNLIKILTIEWG